MEEGKKIKILFKQINEHAWLNNTWLAPYEGYKATLFQQKGRIHMLLDGVYYYDVQEKYRSEYNGWYYNIFNIVS